jgi:hypothetical protein
MSLNDVNKPVSVIPSITGYPQLDTMIRYALLAAAAAITGIIVTWLNAHGFTDPNLTLMVSGAVISVLGIAAVFVWGFVQNKLLKTSVVAHVVSAARTGNIPATVQAAITPAVEIKITDDLNAKSLADAKGA